MGLLNKPLLLLLLLLCSRQIFLLSIHCSRVQARGRIYFSDSTFLSMWAVPSIVILLDFIGANVTRDSTSDLV